MKRRKTPATIAAATSSTKNTATTAATASTSPTPVVATPPGVLYGRSRSGSRKRRTMCETSISTYDTVAPKTAI